MTRYCLTLSSDREVPTSNCTLLRFTEAFASHRDTKRNTGLKQGELNKNYNTA